MIMFSFHDDDDDDDDIHAHVQYINNYISEYCSDIGSAI